MVIRMTNVFISVLQIGMTAGWLILAVLAARFLLKRMPKTWHCFLWYLVMIRLLIPFSVESPLSLIPHTGLITSEMLYSRQPVKGFAGELFLEESNFKEKEVSALGGNTVGTGSSIEDGVDAGNLLKDKSVLEQFLTPSPGDSVNPLQIIIYAASLLWLVGTVFMLLYALLSYANVKKSVREAVRLKENIYQCSYMDSPFVLGIVRPKIYVPFSLSEESLACVIAHEKTHIKRMDPILRMTAFFLLSIYWFHPLVWIFYLLFYRDMELACDEMVIKQMGAEQKKCYSRTLVECSSSHKKRLLCSPAFGENSVKQRVKNILRFRRPTAGLIAGSFVLLVILILCFMTNPVNGDNSDPNGKTAGKSTQQNGQDLNAGGLSEDNLTAAESMAPADSHTEYDWEMGNAAQIKEGEIWIEPPLLLLQDTLSGKYDPHALQPLTYQWSHQSEDGPMGIARDCEHPLEIAKRAEPFILPHYNNGENEQEEVVYQFFASTSPDQLKISEYAVSEAGNTDAKPLKENTLTEQNLIFSLKKDRIYVLHAFWEEENFDNRKYYGDAIYVLVTGEVNALSDVTMYMKEYSASEGSVEIKNDSDKQIEYGDWYDIQIKKNGEWHSMPLIVENAAYHEVAYLIEANSVSEWKINWSHFYGELPQGKYRLVKKIDCLSSDSLGGYDSGNKPRAGQESAGYYLAAEFEIE